MYAKCGKMPDACSIFQAMPCHTHASWNTLIAGFVENGQSAAALEIFFAMEEQQRNALTFVAAAMACASLKEEEEDHHSIETAMEIHSAAVKSGFGSEAKVASTLVDMYAKCGSMANARKVFSSIDRSDRDVVCWTSLIQGYADNGLGEEALEIFSAMSIECRPNSRTFVAALLACSCSASRETGREIGDGRVVKVRSLEIAMEIHSRAVESSFDSDIFVASSLLDAYSKCGSLVDARMVFDRMRQRDVVFWTALLIGYVENEEFELALELFPAMAGEGFEPAPQSFVAALMACASLAVEEDQLISLDRGMALHSRSSPSSSSSGSSGSNIFLGNTLIDMYCKCGSVLDARTVFDRMFHHNLVSWNALIAGYAENRESELALELFSRLELEPEECFVPNAVTFAAVLLACTELASLEHGRKIHARICRCALESQELVANKLVDLYGKCGCMVDAELAVCTMVKPSLVTWNALIAGYSRRSGSGSDDDASSRVFSSFERMRREETAPNEVTMLLLLAACSHAGLVDRGRAYFGAMVSFYKLTPAIEHYHCLADALGRANKLDEAVKVVTSMPYEATAISWKTILSSCRKWKNVEIGRTAFDALIELGVGEPDDNSAAYLLMANLYGSLGMWNQQAEVLEMRRIML